MTLGLAMIVRNEADVIRRCLMSVRDHIDYWTIIDTGSGDGTKALILELLDDKEGVLIERPWVDFGFNRTELLGHARGKTDHILCLDADMTLDAVGDPPRYDANLVRYTGDLDYQQALLISGQREWHYTGRTHEYLDSDTLFSQGEALHWSISHHLDGSGRGDKFSRDLELLKLDVADDPTNPRATFYLGQTYRDLGETANAIDAFRQRVALGGWDQEQWYAQFQIGLLAWDPTELSAALAMRPTRAEPLLYLAQIAAEDKRTDDALAFCEAGLDVPYPNDTLFIEKWIYEWGLPLEYAAALWHAGRHDDFKLVSMRLLAQPPDHIIERIQQNLLVYG